MTSSFASPSTTMKWTRIFRSRGLRLMLSFNHRRSMCGRQAGRAVIASAPILMEATHEVEMPPECYFGGLAIGQRHSVAGGPGAFREDHGCDRREGRASGSCFRALSDTRLDGHSQVSRG